MNKSNKNLYINAHKDEEKPDIKKKVELTYDIEELKIYTIEDPIKIDGPKELEEVL